MREAFITRRFTAETLARIDQANAIIDAYRAQGYTLTLRQLYYQHVARGLIPNNERSYKNLGNVISDARMAGYIDWDAIEDRGRVAVQNTHWDDPAQIVDAAARTFMTDKWKDQPVHIEVMVEKQALENVFVPACRQSDVLFIANKGYSSSSAVYEAAKRMWRAQDEGKEVHVLYCGDHDPSGIDMTRDVGARLRTLLRIAGADEYQGDLDTWADQMRRWDEYRDTFQVHRLALTMDQVVTYHPPENPAKITDSRARGYIQRFGQSSWELDALEPQVLAGLITQFVGELRGEELWDEATERERVMVDALTEYANQWESGNGAKPSNDPIAERIIAGLEATKGAGLTKTEISALLGRNVPATKINDSLRQLARSGRVRSWKAQTGGAPATSFVISSYFVQGNEPET